MKPLYFLHGALGTEKQLHSLMAEMENREHFRTLTFEGHGKQEMPDRPFRIEHFAENLLVDMDRREIESADIFGYSMGGYVALWLALHHPERVGRVATLGTVLEWSPEKATSETRFLNIEKMKKKVPEFVAFLAKEHPSGWEEVAAKTDELLTHLGANPLIEGADWERIKQPVRFHTGDRDATATPDSAFRIVGKLPFAELCTLPGTPHPVQKANLPLLAASLEQFFNS
ncbi:MAG: alpha/beta fold hydrolase [Balneolaceae bacterium]|nr:alpha/beta fold hydrolase [Balneolaceae bacterium]MCH8548892.1 alpha/beta hydrolase [Balneolaceae bacterium]